MIWGETKLIKRNELREIRRARRERQKLVYGGKLSILNPKQESERRAAMHAAQPQKKRPVKKVRVKVKKRIVEPPPVPRAPRAWRWDWFSSKGSRSGGGAGSTPAFIRDVCLIENRKR